MEPLSAPLLLGDASDWLRQGPMPCLADTPLIDVEALIAGARRAVIVAPRPEDEVLGTGGLLAEFAAFGLDTLIIGVTDGEATRRDRHEWTRETLRAKRVEESVQALEALGADTASVRRLRIADGGVSAAEEELTRCLGALLRPGDLVFTTWDRDGHPDHAACHRAVARAVFGRPLAAQDAPVWMWSWADPDDPSLPWSDVVRVELGRTAQARKQRALQMFRSLLCGDAETQGSGALSAATLERFILPFETLIHAPEL